VLNITTSCRSFESSSDLPSRREIGTSLLDMLSAPWWGLTQLLTPLQLHPWNLRGDLSCDRLRPRWGFYDLGVAYLYSTQVNLEDFVGKRVTLLVSPRPNNNFAFPAYYVFEVE